jgi:hypothetical protein
VKEDCGVEQWIRYVWRGSGLKMHEVERSTRAFPSPWLPTIAVREEESDDDVNEEVVAAVEALVTVSCRDREGRGSATTTRA